MIQGRHNESGQSGTKETEAGAPVCRENGGAGVGSRTSRRSPSLSARGDRAGATIAVEGQVPARGDRKSQGHQTRSEVQGRSCGNNAQGGDPAVVNGITRDLHRAASDEKKRTLGLTGPLYGKHLTKDQRESIKAFVDEGSATHTIDELCAALEIHRRSYYRWKKSELKSHHGGGGGKNKIRPKEERAVLNLAKKFPEWHCRRIAYTLEKKATVFIGKTKVAEIMKAHGLNHPFERGPAKPIIPPADMLLHEPWKKNLTWGMDWTWVNVDGRFMFLLVLLDWYSRKILSWGLYNRITQYQVVTVVTEAVAIEQIDLLPKHAMKPRIVADHGSANCAAYTKDNIEIQGLDLWLSGIGRPTGNARTERVIGTLKREEINLQEQYENETVAHSSIGTAIWDYNFNRPNQGNGGFAPNSVHHNGRHSLAMRREKARQRAAELRRKHWGQEQSPSDTSLT
jgi:putative transposase